MASLDVGSAVFGRRTARLVAAAALLAAGCGRYDYRNVRTVDDDNFHRQVSASPVPVIVFFEEASPSSSSQAFAPVLDRFARAFAGRIRACRYVVGPDAAYFERYRLPRAGLPVLMRGGGIARQAPRTYEDEAANLGLLVCLLADTLKAGAALGTHGYPRFLQSETFDDAVAEARPSIVAFFPEREFPDARPPEPGAALRPPGLGSAQRRRRPRAGP